jgi:hypothetical protein
MLVHACISISCYVYYAYYPARRHAVGRDRCQSFKTPTPSTAAPLPYARRRRGDPMHMGDGDPSMIPSIRVAGRPAANCVLTSVRHAERGVRWSIAVAVAHTPDRNRIIHGTLPGRLAGPAHCSLVGPTQMRTQRGSDPSRAAMSLAVAADPTGRCMSMADRHGREQQQMEGGTWPRPGKERST